MATVTRDQLVRPVEETARQLALAWLAEADAALERLADPEDEEALHDFRVSLRRFRSSLRAYQPYLKGSSPKKARRRIRDLASATNAGRDAEVQIAWLNAQTDKLKPRERKGLRWLLERLEARRDQAYREAQRSVARQYRTVRGKVADRLSTYRRHVAADGSMTQRPFAQVTGELLEEHAAALGALLSTVHTPEHEAEAHNSRIAAKRLRYLLEPLVKSVDETKPLIKQLKRLQDLLGDLHDTHVLTAEVAAAIETAAAERARRLHEEALGRELSRARQRTVDSDETHGLLALTDLLRQRRDRLFGRLEKGWLGENATGFFGHVNTLARRLRLSGVTDIEIERKYLLSEIPSALRRGPSALIEQGWLPGEVIQERLWRTRAGGKTSYHRTVESGSGPRPTQIEERISRRQFESLWPLTESRRLRKRRYTKVDGALTWEIDVFQDRDLVLAEVELPYEGFEVQPPDWLQAFVRGEVTGESAYEGVNLARRPGKRAQRAGSTKTARTGKRTKKRKPARGG